MSNGRKMIEVGIAVCRRMRYTEGQQCAGTLKGAATLALRQKAVLHSLAICCKRSSLRYERIQAAKANKPETTVSEEL